MNSFFKIALVTLIIAAFLSGISQKLISAEHVEVSFAYGSRGRAVEEIQQTLKESGLFYGEITGYFGSQTEAAVGRFQQYNGLPATGIADSVTLRLLGVIYEPVL
jgi:peptidoglycan hydrolase-like protein with peptidoglycan-binding domain